MVSCGLELTGISLSVLGWVLSVISCVLPMWRVSTCDDPNIAQLYWEGLWMSCVSHNTGQMECNFHHSMQDLPQDLQVARILTTVAVILGLVALLIFIVEDNCSNCNHNERVKARLMVSSGGMFITAALLQLVPVFWSAFTIIVEFSSPLILCHRKRKTGMAQYLGWFASTILLIGGSILFTWYPEQKDRLTKRYNTYPQTCVIYSATPGSTSQSSHHKKD
ncbi:claudin-4-like [Mugil cephalus]|uniref:claudin-4-like n=1 Tax=Mugil cephalus TaxID=48193 RepID=UPI001FB66C8A|nr:claudin-4-like [Mugil cephalus]